MRARLIGIGIVAIILAVAVQLRTDATYNVNEAPALSTRPALPINGPVARDPELFFVHPQNAKGELIAFDMATARPAFHLARGLPTPEEALLYGEDRTRRNNRRSSRFEQREA